MRRRASRFVPAGVAKGGQYPQHCTDGLAQRWDWASARVCGVQPKCKPTFFWGGWQKIVAQIRGVFRKMITNTPPGGQNLAQNGVFTPRFRLHTGVTRLLDVFFDRASVFFEVGAIPVLLILGTIPFRPRVLTLHVTAYSCSVRRPLTRADACRNSLSEYSAESRKMRKQVNR